MDELRQRLATFDRGGHLADVVLVPEDDEDANVVARRFRERMLRRSDRQGQVVGRFAARLHQLEVFDRLGNAVLADLEVVLGQIRHKFAVTIDDADVDPHEVCAAFERRTLFLRRRRRLRQQRGDTRQPCSHRRDARERRFQPHACLPLSACRAETPSRSTSEGGVKR